MKRILTSIGVLLGFMVFSGSAVACGLLLPKPGYNVTPTETKAVIWHDGKKETLILSTTFQGSTSEFAWIIPVPNKPEVDTVHDEIFTALADLTAPKYSYDSPVPMPMPVMNRVEDTYVNVIESKRVDIYDVAVLEANDESALRKWLVEKGYEYPANREYLLKSYIDRGWYFVVAKVSSDALGYAGSFLMSGHAAPLRMAFDSKQMILPLKISGPAGGNKLGKFAAFSFESGMEGWTGYRAAAPKYNPSGTIEISNDMAWNGTSSLKIWGTNQIGDAYGYQNISGLVPGEKYVFSAYVNVRRPVVGSFNILGGAYIKVQGGAIAIKSQILPLKDISGWTRMELPFTANYHTHEFDLIANEMENGAELYWDGVQVEKAIKASQFEGEMLPLESNWPVVDSRLAVTIYAFSSHKQFAPGFDTEYAGYVSGKTISKLAFDDTGKPWMNSSRKMYLTKLTRNIALNEIADDVILREADDNKFVGSGGLAWDGNIKVWLILGIPVIAEILVICYLWYRRKK